MFHAEFYPTPSSLAWQMAKPYLDTAKSVLDPSAGKGDLLKPFLPQTRYGSGPRLYAIEPVPELVAALNSLEGVRVIGNDFLSYSGRHRFDLIIMNPPFSNADEHLLKAWEVVDDGGTVVCLLPETMLQGRTARQQLMQDIVRRGTVEPLGSQFAKAERRTNVHVCKITLKKPAAAQTFDFGNYGQAKRIEISDDIETNLPARQDTIGNLVLAHGKVADHLKELCRHWHAVEFYLKGLGLQFSKMKPEENLDKSETPSHAFNAILDEVTRQAWHEVVSRSKVADLFTERMHKDFDKFIDAQGAMDFSAPNIAKLFETLFMSRHTIADQCVQDVFDKLCSYDKKNKIHVEGWKTNDAHKVNRKVIMPGFVEYGWNGFHVSYYRDRSALDDIDKALCHVTGRSFASIVTIHESLNAAFKIKGSEENTAESSFFRLKFYKKGTLHLEFKDKKVWELFNVTAARGRGWIGDAKEAA